MSTSITRTVTVQIGGRIEVFVPELSAGTVVEVTVREFTGDSGRSAPSGLRALIGTGRGVYQSIEAADQHVREERDAWR